MRISWTSKMTNKEEKDKIKEAGGKELKIVESIKKRKLAYCRHIFEQLAYKVRFFLEG